MVTKNAVTGNFQLMDDFQVPYAVIEINADGKSVAPAAGDTCETISSVPGSLVVVKDAAVDPAKVPADKNGNPQVAVETGFFRGVPGQDAVGVTTTSTIAKADPNAPIVPPIVDTFDVVTDPATTGIVALGTPQPQ
jgi:hypothetical protein